MSSEDVVARTMEFLKIPVPPSRTKEWSDWQEQCRALGQASVDVFLDALENGAAADQYAAALSLRLFGYEVFGESEGADWHYLVKSPGASEVQVVRPKITPEPYSAP
jgi:hypothetical protein